MDDMPPRVIVQPDAENPVTVPDDLLPEWRDEPIARRQEYIRADLAAAALEAKEAEIRRLRAELMWQAEQPEAHPFMVMRARAALQRKD